MGFEYIEMIWVCEEEFDIKLPEESFASGELSTVGGLYRHIMRTLPKPPPLPASTPLCPNVPVFFTLRAALVEKLNVDKSRITPRADLSELIPLRGRNEAWRTLTRSLPFRIPGLHTAVPYAALGLMAILASLVIAFYPSWLLLSDADSTYELLRWFFPCLGVAGLLSIILFIVMATVLERCLPAKTVGSLIEDVAAHEYDRVDPDGEFCGPDSVWVRYQNIVADRLGFDIGEVTPETTFRELGID